MKTKLATILVLASIALLPSVPMALAGSSSAAHRSFSSVYMFSDGSVVAGASSMLVTYETGVSAMLRTSGLPAGNVVTMWWVIFNYPQYCSGVQPGHPFRCGLSDLGPFGGDERVQSFVGYAAGKVVGASGMGSYGSYRGVGDTLEADLFGPGLLNPSGADIHLVVHDHGLLFPNQIAEGIHNFGPCTYPPDQTPDGSGCIDIQFAVHEQ